MLYVVLFGPRLRSYLFHMDALLGNERPSRISDAWIAVASHIGNATALVRFLMQESDNRELPFITRAKRIVRDLVQSNPAQTLDLLLQQLTSIGMKATHDGYRRRASDQQAGADARVATLLDEVAAPVERCADDSPGSRLPLLLVDSIVVNVEYNWAPSIPTLLQAALIGMDHPAVEVYAGSKQLLLNLIYIATQTSDSEAHQHSGYQNLVSFLMDPDMKQPWPLEDISAVATKIESEAKIADLVSRLLDLFAHPDTQANFAINLREAWGSEAVRWATNCVHRHNAGRSLQILRAIRPQFTDLMLGDLLMRLADVVADPSLEAQAYAADVLLTLVVVVQTVVQPRSLGGEGGDRAGAVAISPTLLPRLFATAVSLLESEFDSEFAMAVRLISHTLDSPEFLKDSLQQTLNRMLEALEWRQEFPGIHEMVTRGLSHPSLTAVVMGPLSQMTPLLKYPLIDRQNSLSLHTAALLPLLLLHYEDTDRELTCTTCAQQLAVAVQPANDLLSRLFTVYANNTYTKGPEDWLADVAKYFAKAFFPAHDVRVLSLLTHMLEQGDPVFYNPAARLLASLMKASAASENHLQLHGGELINVTMRLLRQHQWEASLCIMDATLALSSSDGGIRMEMEPVVLPAGEEGRITTESDKEAPNPAQSLPFQRQGWSSASARARRAREQLGRVLRTYGRELVPLAKSIVFRSMSGDLGSTSSPAGELTLSDEELVVSEEQESGGVFTEFDILDSSAVKTPVSTSSPALLSGDPSSAVARGMLPIRIQDESTAAIARARFQLRPLDDRRSFDSHDLPPGRSPAQARRPLVYFDSGSDTPVGRRPRTNSDPGDLTSRLRHLDSLDAPAPLDRDKSLSRVSLVSAESPDMSKDTHSLTPSKQLATTS